MNRDRRSGGSGPSAEGGTDAATRSTRRRYDRQARTYDFNEWLPERLLLGRLRRRLWRQVEGPTCLEIGVGTGKNLAFHPAHAEAVAVDLSRKMLARAARRARRPGQRVEFIQADAQRLPFRDGAFDAAVATFVFCSVPDPVAGLQEARRVLRPGGRLHLLDHVRSGWAPLGWLMDRLNPLTVRVSGANINRDTEANVVRSGFTMDSVDRRLGAIVKLMRARPEGGEPTARL